MSYGFEFRNDFGEVVVDDKSPVFSITSTGTLVGTFLATSGTFGDLYSFTILQNDELVFFRLPSSGDLIYRAPQNLVGPNGWVSTRQNLQFFRCKRVNATPAPFGFGMTVFDGSGGITFNAQQDTAAINEGIPLPFTTETFPSSSEWYAIPNAYQGIFSISGSTFNFRGTGVFRNTSTTIRSVDTDHPSFPPFLALTANS